MVLAGQRLRPRKSILLLLTKLNDETVAGLKQEMLLLKVELGANLEISVGAGRGSDHLSSRTSRRIEVGRRRWIGVKGTRNER